ncbi:MAG: TIGR00299 family protein [Desulfobulbus propionicus]|nr:MAG: TIGR00299 family protein [Desulfobulbus propionicus]
MRTGYLDCFSGVSGNMLLGALLDAGLSRERLEQQLAGLHLEGFRLEIESTMEKGFHCHRVQVHTSERLPHRCLADIRRILQTADLDDQVRQRSLAVFTRLAVAEAQVHGTSMEQVHFHEAGALDAIVDIVGTVAGLKDMGVERLYCSPLPLPGGWVHCAHGDIPLPGPAVCRLLEGMAVYGVELQQELVTPTGAALVRELAESAPLPPMILECTGYGAGTMERADHRPNLLRLLLGRERSTEEAPEVEVIETHVDDLHPEHWPDVCDRLMELPVLDACLVPMQMKKGRPGFLIRVICTPEMGPAARSLLLEHSSAIGLRYRREQRQTLAREPVMVDTRWGPVLAKRIITDRGGERITPEYEACRKIARTHNLSLQEVYRHVLCAADNRRKE